MRIHIENISKSYDKKQVLKNLNLEIHEGEILGLVGKNGVGKTTLLSILANLIDADSGSIKCDGSSDSLSRLKIGYLPDVPSFYDYLTAEEYMAFLNCNVCSKKDILQTMKELGVDPKASIKSLSRGMRQRLGMAAVLINNPDVILLDEPSSALDPEGRAELSNLLISLKKSGKAIVLSTHILSDMEKICDTVAFLKDGCISKIIDTNSLSSTQRIIFTFERCINDSLELPFGVSAFSEAPNKLSVIFNYEDTLAQKKLFELLCSIDNLIINIEIEQQKLDTLFEEVCL